MANRLEDILAIVTANSDEAVDDFLVLSNPENHTKEEVQQSYIDIVGYDPTNYYDIRTLREMLDKMKHSNDIPRDVIDTIESDEDSIIDDALERYELNKESHLSDALNFVIEERTGHNLSEEE